jgi:hypothetical protein
MKREHQQLPVWKGSEIPTIQKQGRLALEGLPDSASPALPRGLGGRGRAHLNDTMDAGYQNTISGLLRKWGEMLANMAEPRGREHSRHGAPNPPPVCAGKLYPI